MNFAADTGARSIQARIDVVAITVLYVKLDYCNGVAMIYTPAARQPSQSSR